MAFCVSRRCLVAVAIFLPAAGQVARAHDVSGSVTATTDYVFRGITQSQGDPALQGGVRIESERGPYAALWASTVRFSSDAGASTEVDGVLGWRRDLNETWVADVNVTRFKYPNASTSLSYTELIAVLTRRGRDEFMLGYSTDVFASGKTGIYVQAGTKVPLGNRGRFELSAGYYALNDAYGRGYAHGRATVGWQARPGLDLRLSGHVTDSGARALFGEAASARVEAAVQASF
jgi:uncharacterized protein (TIGR02001 family)